MISKEMDSAIEKERKEYEDAVNELKRHDKFKTEMEEYEFEM
jgi:ubiquitin